MFQKPKDSKTSGERRTPGSRKTKKIRKIKQPYIPLQFKESQSEADRKRNANIYEDGSPKGIIIFNEK